MFGLLAKTATAAVFSASMVFAQDGAQRQAQLAIEKLNAAAQELTNAPKARDRVRALIKTVQAYEAGLEALRLGARQVALREQALLADLQNQDAKVAGLLGALQLQQRSTETMILLHPSGPLATVRAGMMMAQAAPALDRDAAVLRAQLQELRDVQSLQLAASEQLLAGLQGVQNARSNLSLAIAERSDLPRRFTADPQAMRQLLDSSETLAGFAKGLGASPLPEASQSSRPFATLHGVLPLPVRGTVLRGFDQPDAAGIPRPGWIVSTAPRALVTAPAAATIRYQGPLLDYGNVMILEPEKSYLIILAGLGEVFAKTGQVVPAGAALAFMGSEAQIAQGFDTEIQQDGGNPPPETLYIEIRKGNTPVDPTRWFKVNKD